MKISIIIPNYNGKYLLQKNLPFVLKACKNAEIIIVDDGSKDDSVNFIEKNYPKIKVIKKLHNDGFSISVNIGVKAASCDFVYLLNSDVAPQLNFLEYILPHFKEKNVFAVGSMDLSYENGQVIKRGRGIGSFIKGFLFHKRGEVNKQNTLWAAGGSSAFRKNIWEKLGGFQELYSPFYWEDIDLSYRAQKAGYKIVFEPKSIVEHHHEQGSIKQKYSQSQIIEIVYRNQIIFVWLNITDKILLFSHIIRLPYLLFKSILKGEINFVKGMMKAFLMLPRILYQRKIQKKLFIKSDFEILNSYTS